MATQKQQLCRTSADGGVFAFGNATSEGSAGSLPLQGPIVAMATTPDAKGYWLGALDGGVFAYGNGPFYRSIGGTHLNKPIVGMTSATPDRQGLLAGRQPTAASSPTATPASTGARAAWGLGNAPIVGMASTHDGKGNWLVAADGGVFTFGDANFYGSASSSDLPDAAVGMVASPDGGAWFIATENGVVLPYGDAQAFGGLSLRTDGDADLRHHREQPGDRVLAARPAGVAVQLLHRHPRTDVPRLVDDRLRRGLPDRARPRHPGPVLQSVRALRGVVRPVRHLASEQAGIPIPRYAFTGDIWDWAATYGVDLPPTATPAVGDAILYGTGPGAPPPPCTSGS